jgi:hypothetical protein
MPKQYTKEELWKLYEKLPQELKDAVFAEETANQIGDICERYKVPKNIISEIAKQVGNVLLGILPPEDLQEILEKEIKLEKSAAKKVTQEITRFIFYPVRTELEKLYQKKDKLSGETQTENTTSIEAQLIKDKKQPTEPKKEDTYRELIE